MTRSVACRRLASSAAHRSAAADAGDPLTPTTMAGWFPFMAPADPWHRTLAPEQFPFTL